MKIKLPKIRLNLNRHSGQVSLSKITPKTIFTAKIEDVTKNAARRPYVRNRGVKMMLNLLWEREKIVSH